MPNIDCVLFADPKRSTIDIVQAVGRALRPSENKEYGYVVVPVLIDDKIEDMKTAEISGFTEILTTLRALASNDERIVEYFRSISQGRHITSRKESFEIDIPIGLEIDSEKFINSIELKLWSRLAKLSWRPFDEARKFVHSLHLRNRNEWKVFCNGEMEEKGTLPEDIPSNANTTYKNKGWSGWGDWVGTGTVAPFLRKYRSFKGARAFVHKLGLKNQKEWRQLCNGQLPEKELLPDDIPRAPWQVYKGKGWKNMGDWLGTGNVAVFLREYRPFEKARDFACGLALKSGDEWTKFCKGDLPQKGVLPKDIPAKPSRTYEKKGWAGMGDWLGTGTIAPYRRKFRPFKEARRFVHSLELKGESEWREFSKGDLPQKGVLPKDIPSGAASVYKDKGWKGWGDFLGTGAITTRYKEFRSFKKARAFVFTLKPKRYK